MKRIQALVALFLFALSAKCCADDFYITGWGQSAAPLTISTSIYTGPVGRLQGVNNPEGMSSLDFYVAYSVSVDNFSPYGYYDADFAAGYFSQAKEDALSRLLSLQNPVFQAKAPWTATQFAGMQLAVWNTIFDSDADVTAGVFSTGASDAATFANWLISASATAHPLYDGLTVTCLDGAQCLILLPDQRFVSLALTPAVAEPASEWLLLAGLLAFLLNRRWKRA